MRRFKHPRHDKVFCLFLIQQKEHLQPSKLKLPVRNLLLTHASAQKTHTIPPRSPTLAVSMLRHLRERRAAPKHSSIWSLRSWAYLHCHSQKCNRAATVGKLTHRPRRWTAAMAILASPASNGNHTPAPDLPHLNTLRTSHVRGMPMIRPAARPKIRLLPSWASAPVERQTRRRMNQSRRPHLSQSWSRMSLTAAATSGEHLTSLTVWRRLSRQKPSPCQAISLLTSKWMLRNFWTRFPRFVPTQRWSLKWREVSNRNPVSLILVLRATPALCTIITSHHLQSACPLTWNPSPSTHSHLINVTPYTRHRLYRAP